MNDFFDLEDDELFVQSLRNISEHDLTSVSVSSPSKNSDDCKSQFLSETFNERGMLRADGYLSSVTDKLIEDEKSKNKISNYVSTHLNQNVSDTKTVSYVNNRFTPGFTPKAKKRKLPGPAGLISDPDDETNSKTEPGSSNSSSPKQTTFDIDFQSSQFSPETLLVQSWQRLQADVSSCPSLLSTAKHYSIQRVLHESSRMKLPKHMIVPVICVFIKTINFKGSAITSVFMDDTGEINGKIDSDVMKKHKEHIVEGTALILKEVTFLCNILLLKASNVVSVYLADGSMKCIQDLEHILNCTEPLKPINCGCIMTSDSDKAKNNFCLNSRGAFTSASNSLDKSLCSNHVNNRQKTSSIKKTTANVESPVVKKLQLRKPFQNPLEDLLCDDNGLDDFDELLGSLDEKSIMGDM